MTRVALLARVSTDEQAEGDRLSLPAQLRVMRERCEREGWEVVVGPGVAAAVESEREKRLLEICVKAWRRHLQEQAERKDKGAA